MLEKENHDGIVIVCAGNAINNDNKINFFIDLLRNILNKTSILSACWPFILFNNTIFKKMCQIGFFEKIEITYLVAYR